MTSSIRAILAELSHVFAATDFSGEKDMLNEIIRAEKIVCAGAGRVGLAVAGFAKRLRHLGKDAFWIEDVTVPRTGRGDLLFIASGSGETRTMLTIGRIAKENGLTIVLLTSNQNSSLSEIADVSVTLKCPNKLSSGQDRISAQPMTTLFEQSCQLFLDSLVLELMRMTNTTELDMTRRHNEIE